jgi:hypothetical protein
MAPQRHSRCRCIAAALLISSAALSPPMSAAPPFPDARHVMTHMERLPEDQLKSFYLRCDRESSQRLLSVQEAVECSIAADVLKERSFGGDFEAMLTWWRRHRDGS